MNLTPEQFAQHERLEAHVKSMRLTTPEDAARFAAKAALLAAIGRTELANRWTSLDKELGFQWIPLLRRRGELGCWDLENSGGEFLAAAVWDAQEFLLFRRGSGSLLFGDDKRTVQRPDEVPLSNVFDDWFDRANDVRLDDDAAAMLQDFAWRYALPEDLQLLPVAYPISDNILKLVPPHGPTQMVIHGEWLKKDEPVHQLARQLADRHVSRYLQKKLEREGRFDLPDGTRAVVHCSISPDWVIHVSVTSSENDLLPVRSIRLGETTAIPRTLDNTATWLLHLQQLDKTQQDQLLREPLIVRFTNGYSLRIAGG